MIRRDLSNMQSIAERVEATDVLSKQRDDCVECVDLVAHSLPPAHDAIGEYTACLAAELALRARVRVLTCGEQHAEEIEGVSIVECHQGSGTGRYVGLMEGLLNTPADALVLQYNPFCWGR
ncbi:MAG: hypothetical protein AAF497_25010, partial [Planctomycetota bacterium]